MDVHYIRPICTLPGAESREPHPVPSEGPAGVMPAGTAETTGAERRGGAVALHRGPPPTHCAGRGTTSGATLPSVPHQRTGKAM